MARHSLARRLGVATASLVLIGGVSACGGDDGTASDDSGSPSSSESDSSESAEPEGDDGGEEASGDLQELSSEDFYQSMVAALKDAETAKFSITSAAGAAGTTEMTGEMRYADSGIEMTGSSTGQQPMEFVLIDKAMYISGAGMPLPDGKKWLKVDLSDPNSLFGQLGKSTDPESMFKAMEAPKGFELVGEEDVDGVAANHYRITMETAAFMEAMELPTEMADLMPPEIVSDMWLDAENRPVKFTQEVEMPNPQGSGDPVQTSTEGYYTDFGSDVAIEAPPAAEVADNIPGMS